MYGTAKVGSQSWERTFDPVEVVIFGVSKYYLTLERLFNYVPA